MPTDYRYAVAQCDVTYKKTLRSYRDKRGVWLSWIETDEHHAIWQVLSSMIWTDVSFRTLTSFAVSNEESSLNNTLLAEALLNGHVATQVLAIRRLMDDGNSDIISLRRLVKDLKKHFDLFTRENYVCFDGLPYDYEAVQRRQMAEHLNKGFFWGATSGPEAWGTSKMAHEQFDRLAGIDPANRKRDDRLPNSLLTKIEGKLGDSGADDLAKWSHAYLAHAGGPEARRKIAALQVTSNKLTDAIRTLCRVTEAISASLLFASGRSGGLMPTAQFDPFDKLDQPILDAQQLGDAWSLWHRLSAERDAYLEGLDAELLCCGKASRSDRHA